jgi:hypothetical protein
MSGPSTAAGGRVRAVRASAGRSNAELARIAVIVAACIVALVGALAVDRTRTWGWDESMHAELPAARIALALRAGELGGAAHALVECEQYPFVYPAVLGAVQTVTGVSEIACRRTGRVLWALAWLGLWFVFEELRRLGLAHASRAATFALVLALASPLAMAYSGTLFLEGAFVCASVWALRAWLARKGSFAPRAELARDMRAGAWLALAFFTKFNYGLLLALGCGLDFAWDAAASVRAGRGREVARARARRSGGPARGVPVVVRAALAGRPRARRLAPRGVRRLPGRQPRGRRRGLEPARDRLDHRVGTEPFDDVRRRGGFRARTVGAAARAGAHARARARGVRGADRAAPLPPRSLPVARARAGLVPRRRRALAQLRSHGAVPGDPVPVGAGRHARQRALAARARPVERRVGRLHPHPGGEKQNPLPTRSLPTAGLLRSEADALYDLAARAAGPDARVGWIGTSSELAPAALHLGLLERGGSRERFLRDAHRPLDVTFEGVDPQWSAAQLRDWAGGFDVVFATDPPDPGDRPERRFEARYREMLVRELGWTETELGSVAIHKGARAPYPVRLFACRPPKP